MTDYDKVRAAADAVLARVPAFPDAALILGSGLGGFADGLGAAVSMPFADLPHWPLPGVAGHSGRLVVGSSAGRQVAVLAGRSHAYEGHGLARVAFSVRVLGLLGVRTLVLTNAAGGVNTGFRPGALMVIDDHVNLMGGSPLAGPNDDRFGPRFPDMSQVYSHRLRAVADQAARASGVAVTHGVYAALLGPSYETPAEIRYVRTIGADAVGMSTVPEALVARHMGLEVLGLSCITNMAAGVLPAPLSHAEVLATSARVAGEFIVLLEAIVARL